MKAINVSMKAVMILMTVAFTTFSAFAGKPVTEEPAGTQVKYIGSVNEQNVFEVSVNGAKEENYIITLKTATGETLYTERFSGKLYSKKFLLENELNFETLLVTVTSVKAKSTETFRVQHNVSTVSDMQISKVK